SPELLNFLLEFQCLHGRHVHGYRDPRRLSEPASGRRARNPEIGSDGQVAGVVDEIPQPVVVVLLRAPRGHHADDHPAVRSHPAPVEGMKGPPACDAAAMTTTRAAKCRMSVRTAPTFSACTGQSLPY